MLPASRQQHCMRCCCATTKSAVVLEMRMASLLYVRARNHRFDPQPTLLAAGYALPTVPLRWPTVWAACTWVTAVAQRAPIVATSLDQQRTRSSRRPRRRWFALMRIADRFAMTRRAQNAGSIHVQGCAVSMRVQYIDGATCCAR